MNRTFIFALLLALLAAACSDPENEVKLIEQNFSDIAPQQGNLSFTFSQPLVPDTFLNQWDSTEYIRFSPPIDGKYSWRSETELVFSPYCELPPATSYEAQITSAVTRYRNELTLNGETKIKFATPSLALLGQNAFWEARANNKERSFLHLKLDFNAAVDPALLEKNLRVEIDDKDQEFEFDGNEIGPSQRIYFSELPMSDEDLELELKLASSMHPSTGSNPMAEALELEIGVASPFKLTITSIKAQHDGNEGEILITTSQEVKAQDIKRFLSLSPSVDYTVEVDGHILRLKSANFDVKQSYDVKLKENLRGVLGGSLKSAYSQQVSFGKLRPSLKFEDNRSVYLTSAGNQTIEASIINVPEVELTIIKVYENNILHFLGGGYYESEYYDYDDYGYRDYYYGGGYNFYQA
ncbi:MAG: hypothetical protein AAFQ68_27970, partial [Bacteroidota bacterium]